MVNSCCLKHYTYHGLLSAISTNLEEIRFESSISHIHQHFFVHYVLRPILTVHLVLSNCLLSGCGNKLYLVCWKRGRHRIGIENEMQMWRWNDFPAGKKIYLLFEGFFAHYIDAYYIGKIVKIVLKTWISTNLLGRSYCRNYLTDCMGLTGMSGIATGYINLKLMRTCKFGLKAWNNKLTYSGVLTAMNFRVILKTLRWIFHISH